MPIIARRPCMVPEDLREPCTGKLWEVRSGACLHTLRADLRYERLDITGLTGVIEAQRTALMALGAAERRA